MVRHFFTRFAIAVTLVCLPLPILAAQQTADSGANQQQEKAYAQPMKDIVFQNDSQWEDNRWEQTDVGPFLAATIKTGKSSVLKGLAIRVGDEGGAAICFDTARMSYSAA